MTAAFRGVSKPGRGKRRYYPTLGSTTNPGEPELNTSREQQRRARQAAARAAKEKTT